MLGSQPFHIPGATLASHTKPLSSNCKGGRVRGAGRDSAMLQPISPRPYTRLRVRPVPRCIEQQHRGIKFNEGFPRDDGCTAFDSRVTGGIRTLAHSTML